MFAFFLPCRRGFSCMCMFTFVNQQFVCISHYVQYDLIFNYDQPSNEVCITLFHVNI